MEDFSFEFEWDFSYLSAVELSKERITISEIKSVYLNRYSVLRDISDVDHKYLYYNIGFSEKKRFLKIFFEIETKIVPQLIQVANESDIRKDYCQCD